MAIDIIFSDKPTIKSEMKASHIFGVHIFGLQSAHLAPGPVQTNAPFQNEDGED